MLTTGEPEADTLLPVLTAGMAAALEPHPRLLGLYLYGSLATGAFTPGVSDIDLLAVTDGSITLETIDRATFRTQFSEIGVISPGEPLHILSAGIDWLMNWHQVRHGGKVITGPPAETYVPDTSVREYVAAVREHAAAFGEWMPEMRTPREQSYAVLTLTRALYTVLHGHGTSKAAAAAWLATRQPRSKTLLEQALRWRDVDPADSGAAIRAYPETDRFVQEMQEAIAATASPPAHDRTRPDAEEIVRPDQRTPGVIGSQPPRAEE